MGTARLLHKYHCTCTVSPVDTRTRSDPIVQPSSKLMSPTEKTRPDEVVIIDYGEKKPPTRMYRIVKRLGVVPVAHAGDGSHTLMQVNVARPVAVTQKPKKKSPSRGQLLGAAAVVTAAIAAGVVSKKQRKR